MIEELIKNEHFRRIFPPVVGIGLILLFVSLGRWQLDRAAEKNELHALFDNDSAYARVTGDMPVTDYQNIESYGYYLDAQQVLIDNMFVDSRIGHYVITPFRYAADEPLLIVNRGWVARPVDSDMNVDLSTGESRRTIRGRVGRLPKVGIRSGEAFEGAGDWPKKAIYPTLDDLAKELDEDVLPFILLLHPEADDGFVRRWQPTGSGPSMHYGYAFQWFAMAAAVFVILGWQLRKRRLRGSD